MSSIKDNIITYYQYCNKLDWNGVRTLFADDFTHEFRPASLGGLGIAARTRDEFFHFVEVELKGILESVNFELPPKQLVVADKAGIAHIFATSDSIRGTKHENEWIHIFRFNDDNKIVHITEFMDSKSVSDELQAIAVHKQNINTNAAA